MRLDARHRVPHSIQSQDFSVKGEAAKAFAASNMFLYNSTALQTASGCKHISLSGDGVYVAGDDTLVTFGVLPEKAVASVPPPQAGYP